MPIKRRDSMSVVVLAGGFSQEREISFESGKNALQALEQAGYGHVCIMDPAREDFVAELSAQRFDAAFIALHGAGGEDGSIQSLLEYLHIPYTGSGVSASVCAADKEVSKIIFEHAGIPVARGVTVRRGEEPPLEDIIKKVGEQCFVKPAINGSSFGVTLVRSRHELPCALALAFESGDKVLIEKRLVGVEITVGIIGGRTLQPLPVVEIMRQPGTEFYDQGVKYIDPALVHRIPAQISQAMGYRAQDLACAAHRALNCFGLSRSDFIVTKEGPVILETNTIPGMTDASLFPDEVRHAGRTFSDVCDELVTLAIDAAAARDRA